MIYLLKAYSPVNNTEQGDTDVIIKNFNSHTQSQGTKSSIIHSSQGNARLSEHMQEMNMWCIKDSMCTFP